MDAEFSDLPRSAAEAVRAGARFYYDGVPCPRGHDSPRYASAKHACVECGRSYMRERDQRRREARSTAPPTRPVAVLGADWSLRVFDGSVEDLAAWISQEQCGAQP